MILVGLPAYNEGRRIDSLVTDIHTSLNRGKNEYRIIVYDDGSTDETVSKIKAMREQGVKVDVILGGENKGLGYALSYLIEYCARTSSIEDTIIIMDADATHNPEHIYRMLDYIKDGFDVVIASRYTPYSRIRGVSLLRQLLSNAANLMFKLLFPIKGVLDYSCSYRAYTAKILKLARDVYKDNLIEERSFACMAELLIKLRRLDIIACEVPLILRYDRKGTPTKMRIASTIFRTFTVAMKLLLVSNRPIRGLGMLKEKYNI